MHRKRVPDHLVYEHAGEVVDVAVLVAALQGRHDPVLLGRQHAALLRLGEALHWPVRDLPDAVGVLLLDGRGVLVVLLRPDRPVADVLASLSEVPMISDTRQIESTFADIWLQSRNTIRFCMASLARRIELFNGKIVVLPHHHVLDNLKVHLLAIALVADLDHEHAGVPLPLALELLDVVPAVGELHAMADAIEQVLVPPWSTPITEIAVRSDRWVLPRDGSTIM